jgi:hypothetical protein
MTGISKGEGLGVGHPIFYSGPRLSLNRFTPHLRGVPFEKRDDISLNSEIGYIQFTFKSSSKNSLRFIETIKGNITQSEIAIKNGNVRV